MMRAVSQYKQWRYERRFARRRRELNETAYDRKTRLINRNTNILFLVALAALIFGLWLGLRGPAQQNYALANCLGAKSWDLKRPMMVDGTPTACCEVHRAGACARPGGLISQGCKPGKILRPVPEA